MSNDPQIKKLSTSEIIKNIALHSDRISLNHLLATRKLFTLDGKRYILPEYLWNLKVRRFYPFISISNNEGKVDEKIDLTYDRTLQKFSILKPDSSTNKDGGPYCDNQYKVLYRKINELISEGMLPNEIQTELEIEKLFKNMIIRHLKYSWLEVCRKTNYSYHRYRWELSDETIELMKPRWIKGNEFRKWLEKNIENTEAQRSPERELVQKQIYEWFDYSYDTSMDQESGLTNILDSNEDPIKSVEEEIFRGKFFKEIATEKSSNSHHLRPAIRILGKEKIYQLVYRILNSFGYDEISDANIANDFGLSKATYSRFAGRDWRKGDSFEIPDLWKNIANVVASDPVFLEAAIDYGVKESIEFVLDVIKEN